MFNKNYFSFFFLPFIQLVLVGLHLALSLRERLRLLPCELPNNNNKFVQTLASQKELLIHSFIHSFIHFHSHSIFFVSFFGIVVAKWISIIEDKRHSVIYLFYKYFFLNFFLSFVLCMCVCVCAREMPAIWNNTFFFVHIFFSCFLYLACALIKQKTRPKYQRY